MGYVLFLQKIFVMQFQTEVQIPLSRVSIRHSHHLTLMGSCFAESMGQRLVDNKFQCDVNPFGILYNPQSIAQGLTRLMDETMYQEAEVREFEGIGWCCWEHHSRFSAMSAEEALAQMNSRLLSSSEWLRNADFLIITFGSAWVYLLKETGRVVANCHKQPERLFSRVLLKVPEIVSLWEPLLLRLHEQNPSLHVLFTVSPVRHLRDGAHANQISKATLLLAVNELEKRMGNRVPLMYFPAYEIMMDELRDYRFYADDMAHPSTVAEQYIWERFEKAFFDAETRNVIEEWTEIRRALNHRPFHPESEEYKRFIRQTLLKIEAIKEKMPYFDTQKELSQCHTLLNR